MDLLCSYFLCREKKGDGILLLFQDLLDRWIESKALCQVSVVFVSLFISFLLTFFSFIFDALLTCIEVYICSISNVIISKILPVLDIHLLQPLIYGRGPTPAGIAMMPMLLPDGRIGYVL